MTKNINNRVIKCILLLFFTVAIIFPLCAMFANLANTNIIQTFQSSTFTDTIINSLLSTTTAAIISIGLAVISAWFVCRSNLKFKKIFVLLFT